MDHAIIRTTRDHRAAIIRDDVIKRLCDGIASNQQAEIDQMKAFLNAR